MKRTDRLRRILAPERVLWVGGAGMAPAIDYMRASCFTGEALALNLKRDVIAGLTCVASLEDLPWVPDLAILVIPKAAVVEMVSALSKLGCGAAICITSGFSESEGGEDLQAALVTAAGEMPLVGPNCPGIANFLDGAAFMMDHFGDHATKRGAAVISNGGAYLSDLGCADRSQPIAYLIGLGNQATVTISDMVDVVLDDPRVTAINIYFEGLGNAADLSRVAAKAWERGVPVVAIKGGQTQAGARAAQSHTASLAGDATVATALFRRFGWIEVTTPSEAIETLKMLTYTAVPNGSRTGFVTSSGSYAVLGGDIAEAVGLEMTKPGADAAEPLAQSLPAYVGPANPLDISDAHGWPIEQQLPIYEAFAQDAYDLFAQVMCFPPEGGWDVSTWQTTTEALATAAKGRPVAFVNTLAEAFPRAERERLIALGVAPLQGMEDGLRAVAHAGRYGAERARLSSSAMRIDALPALSRGRVSLDEASAKQRLATAGLDVPKQWVVSGARPMPEVTTPAAVKAIVPGLLHKSDVGAVQLAVPPAEVETTVVAMRARLSEAGLSPDAFLVEEMVATPVGELLVGLRRVPEVGWTLTLAIGGVAVELMQDSVTLILPTARPQIEAALRSLRLYPLITGYRGRPAADQDVVLDAIERLTAWVLAQPGVSELEINPLLLTTERAVIADAVLTVVKEDLT